MRQQIASIPGATIDLTTTEAAGLGQPHGGVGGLWGAAPRVGKEDTAVCYCIIAAFTACTIGLCSRCRLVLILCVG